MGLLSYLAVCTRPDIAFGVSQLLQYMEFPGIQHWQAVIHLLRYLLGTPHYSITLNGSCNPSLVVIYTDSDFAGCQDTQQSILGYNSRIGSNSILLRSRKQQMVSTSLTKAEYRALYKGVQELVWIKLLLSSFKVALSKSTLINIDNQLALALAKNPLFQQRTKHIDVIYDWICEKFKDNLFKISYISTKEMIANICTKAFPSHTHSCLLRGINVGCIEQGVV